MHTTLSLLWVATLVHNAQGQCTDTQLEIGKSTTDWGACCYPEIDPAFQPLCSCPTGYHISMSYECVSGAGESPPTPPPTVNTRVWPADEEYHCSIDDMFGQESDNFCCDNVKFDNSEARVKFKFKLKILCSNSVKNILVTFTKFRKFTRDIVLILYLSDSYGLVVTNVIANVKLPRGPEGLDNI